MKRPIKVLPGALAVLALSATLVAAHFVPSPATTGLSRASEEAGKTVPVGPPSALPSPDTSQPEASQPPEGSAAPDGSGAPPSSAGPESSGAPQPSNHGSVVSAAAQSPTPSGFDNHGDYVSSIARQNHGQTIAANHRPSTAEPSAGH